MYSGADCTLTPRMLSTRLSLISGFLTFLTVPRVTEPVYRTLYWVVLHRGGRWVPGVMGGWRVVRTLVVPCGTGPGGATCPGLVVIPTVTGVRVCYPHCNGVRVCYPHCSGGFGSNPHCSGGFGSNPHCSGVLTVVIPGLVS